MRRTLLAAVLLVATTFVSGCAASPSSSDTSTTSGSEETTATSLVVTSSAFQNGKPIPMKYAGTGVGGDGESVPLSWTGAPEGTRTFALLCVDRNPAANNFVHWAAINIPATVNSIPDGASTVGMIELGATELTNSAKIAGYTGPAPPAGAGAHKYDFIIFALNTDTVAMPAAPTAAAFEEALKTLTITSAKITGTFETK